MKVWVELQLQTVVNPYCFMESKKSEPLVCSIKAALWSWFTAFMNVHSHFNRSLSLVVL